MHFYDFYLFGHMKQASMVPCISNSNAYGGLRLRLSLTTKNENARKLSANFHKLILVIH